MEKIQVLVEKYKAQDGKIFNYIEECIHHEKILNGERKVCNECDERGYVDMYGDGRVFDTCTRCCGNGWFETKKVKK